MEIYIYIIIFIFGTAMGSFLNNLAVRLSNNESILYPRSHCHSCQHKLRWYELIPVVSYVIQGGKSRCCHNKIPISYLLVEVITGVLFCTSYHSFGFSYNFVISLIFISSLITIIVSDIEYMIILDEVIAVAAIVIIILELIFFGLEYTADKIIAGILAFVLHWLFLLQVQKLLIQYRFHLIYLIMVMFLILPRLRLNQIHQKMLILLYGIMRICLISNMLLGIFMMVVIVM